MVKKNHITPGNISSETVEAEALAWIAQLDGESMTARDQAAFKEWVARSPRHAAEIKELNELWSDLNHLTDMIEPIASGDYAASQLRKQRSRFNWKIAAILPFACLATIGGLSLTTQYAQQDKIEPVIETAQVKLPELYKTRIGEQQEHYLSDGSVVTLNTGSKIEVDFRDDQRRIRLLEGEVLFDVAHDTSRPFLVFAGDGLVRAVGTAFVVRLNESDLVDVIVSEGAVELSSVLPSETSARIGSKSSGSLSNLVTVKAGYSATFENLEASVAVVSEKEMSAKLSWKNGFLTFSGETLDEVIREVSRYTELDIQFKDESLRSIQLGGVFEAGDTNGLFTTLETSFGIHVDASQPGKVTLAQAQ